MAATTQHNTTQHNTVLSCKKHSLLLSHYCSVTVFCSNTSVQLTNYTTFFLFFDCSVTENLPFPVSNLLFLPLVTVFPSHAIHYCPSNRIGNKEFMIVFFMTYLIPILQIPLSPQILNLFLVSSHFILPTHHFSFFFLPFATLIDMCCVCGGFDERCFIFFISFFFPEAI